jgi:DNA invertase Pin-like site-specific DNA recombinase
MNEQCALIYCRVSSKQQKIQGSGLDSQEHRCRLYAVEKGYRVANVFPDDVSGGGDFMNRPGMDGTNSISRRSS